MHSGDKTHQCLLSHELFNIKFLLMPVFLGDWVKIQMLPCISQSIITSYKPVLTIVEKCNCYILKKTIAEPLGPFSGVATVQEAQR